MDITAPFEAIADLEEFLPHLQNETNGYRRAVENCVRQGSVVPGKEGKHQRRTRHGSLLQSLQESDPADSRRNMGICTPSNDEAIVIRRPARNRVRCASDNVVPFTKTIEDLLSRADQGQATFESFRFISGL